MEVLVGILMTLLVLALFPLLLWKRRNESRSSPVQQEEEKEQEAQNQLPPRQIPRAEAAPRHGGARRMRRRPTASASTSTDLHEEVVDESDEDDASGGYDAKSSKRKEKKRQEREAQRQVEEASRESRQAKQDWYSDMRRRKDEEREAEDRLLEEEAIAKKAREEEAAALEFEKWKGAFSVDAEGSVETDAQDGSQGMLSDFVEYIKKQKCVPLEDLAAEFKLRTQECINRINSLEQMGRLSGVMDDRGKYIYISLEEMNAVADYIKRQGRVSISHLASKSNQFIDLEPKVQLDNEIGNADAIAVA